MTTGLMPKCKLARSTPGQGGLTVSVCLLCVLLVSALQLQAGVAVTGVRAEEVTEQIYPGRFIAVCKPAPVFGCVCESDLVGQAQAFPRLTSDTAGDAGLIRDDEHLRAIEWVRLTCQAVTQSSRPR
jgi:hypothetical protein